MPFPTAHLDQMGIAMQTFPSICHTALHTNVNTSQHTSRHVSSGTMHRKRASLLALKSTIRTKGAIKQQQNKEHRAEKKST